jgi:uncharacterized protein (TIGR02466 family)
MSTNRNNYWPTPIFHFDMIWDDHEEIVKECEEWCKTNSQEEPMKHHENQQEYKYLYDDIATDLKYNPKLNRLQTWMRKCVYTAAEEVNKHYWKSLKSQPTVQITDFWAWSSKDYYNHYHGHPNSSWSGIYYLNVDDTHKQGHTRFYSPLPFNYYSDAGTIFVDADSAISYTPRNGMLIVFPSYIRHEGMPYKSDKRRTLIAFNTQIN